MALQHRLGQAAEAREDAQRVREIVKNNWLGAGAASAEALLNEAAALMDRPADAGADVKPLTPRDNHS